MTDQEDEKKRKNNWLTIERGECPAVHTRATPDALMGPEDDAPCQRRLGHRGLHKHKRSDPQTLFGTYYVVRWKS